MSSVHREELVIVVPQKRLDLAKTRLRAVLPAFVRQELSLLMLRHVLGVCKQLPGVNEVFLCGPESLRETAEANGAVLVHGGEKGLRRDITLVCEDWRIMGKAAMLFVCSDLPLLVVEDLAEMVRLWREGADVVLAPQLRERETNAMLVNEPEFFTYSFGDVIGPGSFTTHYNQAIGLELEPARVERIGLQLDVDLPIDVEHLMRTAPDNPLALYCDKNFEDRMSIM